MFTNKNNEINSKKKGKEDVGTNKFYVDMNRKHKEIETDWNTCMRLQKEIGGLNFKSFPSLADAKEYLKENTASLLNAGEVRSVKARGAEIKLLQGLVRYVKDKPKADETYYELKQLEKYKLERIQDFTLTIPGKDNMFAVCRKVQDTANLRKIAEIFESEGKTHLKYEVQTSDLQVQKESLGYLEINLFGVQLYYEFFVKSIPDYSDFDGVCAFVDGSSGGENTITYGGTKYLLYGGAYQFYKNNEMVPFLVSNGVDETGNLVENNPISDGLKGISTKPGNVYGEINSAIKAIEKAEQLGIEKLRIYYDCEQIGGNAPGGVYQNATAEITKKYVKFWNGPELKHLKSTEFIHVDAHLYSEFNEAVDKLAKDVRDSINDDFEQDTEKQKEYLAHSTDYI